MSEVHYRSCNLCEAICGLEIEHENGRVTSIRGDRLDPFSRGHVCPKAFALRDIYEDPDRLRKPLHRVGSEWKEVSWDAAFEEIAERLDKIRGEFGNDAVAVFQGNPTVHNFGSMFSSGDLLKRLKTRNNYTATSVDQLPHHFASWAMFGHPLLIPIPDIDRTAHLLIIGANPLASNGSLMTAPDIINRLEAISARDGKVVLIDPRRTETARVATEHHFIKPATDAYFLLSFINVLFARGLARPGRLAEFTDGIDDLREIARGFEPSAAAEITGIAADEIERLAIEFATAESAVCYGRMGVSTQRFGNICQWLINAINVLTGNLDRAGGAMFTTPALDLLAASKSGPIYDRWRSRIRNLPEFMGELPVATLADEILTPGDGKIRALITSCGNPVLSTPNGPKLEKALESLDLMVSIDIYLNETTRFADFILPPATGLEVSHYDVIFNLFGVRNQAKYSAPLFEKSPDARFDWEIIQELAHRIAGSEEQFRATPPEIRLDFGLKHGPHGLSLEKLRENPNGLDLGALQECLPARLFNVEKRINIAPEIIVRDIDRLSRECAPANDAEFVLIGRRHLRDCNSWLHNSATLTKGRNRCTAMINPEDARRIGVESETAVRVSSKSGSITIPAEVTDSVARGVVSIPHGYGHGRAGVRLAVAADSAGVSINDLTDENMIDELTGNAALNGVPVTVSAI